MLFGEIKKRARGENVNKKERLRGNGSKRVKYTSI
jgi:hypothetical protein